MNMGAWPNRETLAGQLEDSALEFEVISYQADDQKMTVVLKDSKYGTQLELSGNIRGVTIRVKG